MTRLQFIGTLCTSGLILDASFFEHNQIEMPVATNAGEGITQLDLVCNNLDAQEDFYRNVLGLPTSIQGNGILKIIAGTTTIYFKKDVAYRDPIYHFAFNIPENQLPEAISWLKKKNITLAKQSGGNEIFNFVNWNAHAIYFQDAAGNIVEFIARHTLNNASSKEFTSRSILYASEIGLVVPDVPEAVKKVRNDLGFDVYKVNSEDFAAMGNEHNLLILVKSGRAWLGGSANIPAATFPVLASIRNSERKSMEFSDLPFIVKFN